VSDRELREQRRATLVSPDDPNAHLKLGLALLRTGDLEGARAALERSHELAPRREMPRAALREVNARIAALDLPDAQGLIAAHYRVRQVLRTVNDEAPLRVFLATDLRKMRRVVLRARSYLQDQKPGSFEQLGVRLSPARQLRHPHVAPVSDLQRITVEQPASGKTVTHEHHVLATEFRAEPTLDRLIALGPMEPARAVKLLRQILLACEAAHRRGVLHRLLSPKKVHVNANWDVGARGPEDHVRVRDFGVATFLGEAGRGRGLLGTAVLAYAPPEVLLAGPCDHRADLYATGAIGYALLNGAPPFDGSTKAHRLKAILSETPAPLPRSILSAVPRGLEELVMALLARDPEDRPASAREAIERLDASLPPG
jgi:serine/threonine protein kinase